MMQFVLLISNIKACGHQTRGIFGFPNGWFKIHMSSPREIQGENKIIYYGNRVVTILGSGDYGCALAGRLVRSGYTVYIGSRDPNKQRVKQLVQKTGAILTGQETALAQDACAVVIAVGRDHYDYLPLQNLHDRVLIDVSNNTKKRKGPHVRSNAEYLQGLVPAAHVVKGFNVLSAYALENGGMQGSKEVYLAGDDTSAKSIAHDLVRGIGFTPVDWGSLRAARDIEDVPLKLMPSWKRPVAVVFGLFTFHWILAFIQFQICYNLAWGNWEWGWKHLGMQNFNRVIAINALWTLSFCYLPGLFAAYLQLWRGTKYSQFPNWLDQWLKMRKQLGLLMLGMAAMHACISVAMLAPETTEWVYEEPQKIQAVVQVNANTTETKLIKLYNAELNWRGELFLTTGAVALCLTVVLGISSLPSVTATLSWREFTFIQSKLGWVAMITAALHDIFLAWKWMFIYWGCFNTLPIGPQYALYPTFICIVLKLPLLLPPVDKYLQQIRRGYERPAAFKKTDIA
ncbi:unnamed protein product, partial [Meganyctiphanes norvegica]